MHKTAFSASRAGSPGVHQWLRKPAPSRWLRGTATIMTCCSERLHELAAKVGVGGSMDAIRFAASPMSARIGVLAHFRDQLLDSSRPAARVVRMDRADSAGMANVPGLQQRQHLAAANLADAGADRGGYARGRSRYAPRPGAVPRRARTSAGGAASETASSSPRYQD